MTRGFVLGKFMPPHAGHISLCRAAAQMVDQLTILVCSQPDDAMAGVRRAAWMRELFPAARVCHVDRRVPQAPQDSDDFWPIWRAIVREFHPEPIDLVFAGEEYGLELAEQVGGRFVPFLRADGDSDADAEAGARGVARLSGTAVRADPARYWRYLPAPMRRDEVKIVALHGVESVGKSTLAKALAKRLDSDWVAEYGRAHCEVHGNDLVPRDLELIAAAQTAWIDAAREWSGPVLITDTDWLMTAAWNLLLFDRPLAGPSYPLADLYLHLPPDLPWVDDGTRMFGGDADRRRFDAICRDVLAQAGANLAVLDAPLDARLDQALAAIGTL